MRQMIGFLALLAASVSALAQAPPRTPGRVGGSPNNPSVFRPRPTAAAAAAALDPSAALSDDEQKQFKEAQQFIPELTVYDFFQVEYLSKTLHDRNIEVSPSQLTQQIAVSKNHVAAALEKLGVSKGDAKKMYADARADADKRTEQLSR